MKPKFTPFAHHDSTPNMTPLVDVVMVILIFLMLAGSFGDPSRFFVTKQMAHGTCRTPTTGKPLNTPIEVRIEKSVDGFRASGTGLTPTASGSQLSRELGLKRAQFVASGTSADELEIVLYPGRSVTYKSVIEVYDAAVTARYSKVTIARSH